MPQNIIPQQVSGSHDRNLVQHETTQGSFTVFPFRFEPRPSASKTTALKTGEPSMALCHMWMVQCLLVPSRMLLVHNLIIISFGRIESWIICECFNDGRILIYLDSFPLDLFDMVLVMVASVLPGNVFRHITRTTALVSFNQMAHQRDHIHFSGGSYASDLLWF